MALIRIREYTATTEGFEAAVSFDDGTEYPITIRDPFSQKEEEQLEWYFEEWLQFPFTRQVEAHQAAASIAVYGETLFKQVFADPEAYARYKEGLQAGLSRLQLEILASPQSAQFHALHWEALKDPRLPQPLAVQATVVRKNLVPQVVRAMVHPSPTINVLVVTARPLGQRDVGYRTISRPLVESLRQVEVPVQVELLRPGSYQALDQHLREVSNRQGAGYYHVLHLDVHGAVLAYDDVAETPQQASRYLYQQRYGRADLTKYEGMRAFLFFEGEQASQADLVEARELADLLLTHQIPIVILNACQSGKQVRASESSLGNRLMQAGVQLALAMGYSVTVTAAQLLMQTFYRELFADQDLSTAIRQGRWELYNRKGRQAYYNQMIDLEDWLLPVVYQNQPQRLQVREFTAEESKAYYEQQAQSYAPPQQPSYGFVGRDLDILHIEKRLLTKLNLLLVQGMGGVGKTTLLHHLGSWWQTTGLVEQVFYVGYDEKAWTRQQLLTSLAQKLLDPVQHVRGFQPLSLDAQQVLLTKRLRARRYLLILDNLESITGAQLAIQHTLPPEEQTALRRLLADLVGGRTLVLLGSRSREEWLSCETFGDNVYELPGLDPEAASILADRILERNGATKHRKESDFQHLLKLLDGFPLALEVVLANLARQTPKEVLSALQAGDVSLNTGDSQEKTKDIVRCIEYSHSNLSTEVQQLLLCLAPFTSVLWQDQLESYTTYLQQQPLLAQLPFERWPEVIQEVQNWGLLSPDPDIPVFLHLQPILPYFLRNRLQAPEQGEIRDAVETAFRQHYYWLGASLYQLLESKEPQERQVGQLLTALEYENLVTALHLALAAQVSVRNIYFVLSSYVDSTQDQRRGLELSQTVLKRLEAYPAEQLAGPLSAEFAVVIDDIAKQQFSLKQYAAAEASYQKELAILHENKSEDAHTIKKMIASIYHQLGWVAQAQRQWAQAEQYYQQALQIKIEYNDRYKQASTYHQLGMVAQMQRQWAQAEQYYQQALQIFIEYNDHYGQADPYLNLGGVAQQQRQWQQAEQYYQQALQIYIEYNDRYKQASTYRNLGMVAQEQRQWAQARKFFLQALEIDMAYEDTYHGRTVLDSLARLWQVTNDAELPATIASIIGSTAAEVEALLRDMSKN